MGNRNIITAFALCMFFVGLVSQNTIADPILEITKDIVYEYAESAKLREEINLSGITLEEIVGDRTGFSHLDKILMKSYEIPIPVTYSRMEEIVEKYAEKMMDEEWNPILRRVDGDKILLIFGKEENWVRDNLFIVLVSPSEISEMLLDGEIPLSSLDELRSMILESMPDFRQPLRDVLAPRSSPSQQMDFTLRALEEALEESKESTPMEIRYRLALEYQKLGRYAEALEQFNYITKSDETPEWIALETYHGAAQCSVQMGDLESAKRYYRIMLERFGTKHRLSAVALDFLERVEFVQDRSEHAERLMQMADDVYRKGNNHEEAIKLYEDVIKSAPPGSYYASSALLRKAMIYSELNMLWRQIEVLEKAVENYPSAVNHLYLGKAYEADKRYPEALEQYDKVIKEYRNAPKWNLVDAYLGTAETLESFAEAMRENNENEKADEMLEKAKKYYKELLKLPGLYEDPRITNVEKRIITMEKGDAMPFMGLGFRHTGAIKGAHIVTVFKNGPCADSGIMRGDVLKAIDSEQTPNPRAVIKIMGEKKIGDTVTLHIERDEKPMQFKVTLIEKPEKLKR
ncbi:tetratricopeptide repeat protein [Candidatus Poribacteria bacterium]|nr:tetratricopeptide repeat protein [Candidatus Poribacteria bacterium]